MELHLIERTIKTRLTETGKTKDDPQHEIKITIDYSDVTEADILKRAARTDVITFQNKNRELSVEDYMSMDGQTFKADDLTGLSSRTSVVTRPMTPEEQITYVQSLPEDQRESYITKLMEQLTQ